MNEQKWAKALLNMMELIKFKSTALRRMESLREKYNCDNIAVEISLDGLPLLRKFNKSIKAQVRETENASWRRQMSLKASLDRYSAHKDEIDCTKNTYDNGRGSSLLALARAGLLPTRSQKAKSGLDNDTTCMRCGMRPETMEHVIFECNEAYFTEEDLLARLGLHEGSTPLMIETTKAILQKWEKETQTIR